MENSIHPIVGTHLEDNNGFGDLENDQTYNEYLEKENELKALAELRVKTLENIIQEKTQISI